MDYTPHLWQAREGEGLAIYTDTNTGNVLNLQSTPTSITQEGTPFSADWMNEMEQGIVNANVLVGTNDPLPSTSAVVGQFYINTISNKLFQCINSENNTTSWIVRAPNISETLTADFNLNQFDVINVYDNIPVMGVDSGDIVYRPPLSGGMKQDGMSTVMASDDLMVCFFSENGSSSSIAYSEIYSVSSSSILPVKNSQPIVQSGWQGVTNTAVKASDGIAVGFYARRSGGDIGYAIIDATASEYQAGTIRYLPEGPAGETPRQVQAIPVNDNLILLLCGSGAQTNTMWYTYMTVPENPTTVTPTASFTTPVSISYPSYYYSVLPLSPTTALYVYDTQEATGNISACIMTFSVSDVSFGQSYELFSSIENFNSLCFAAISPTYIVARTLGSSTSNVEPLFYNITISDAGVISAEQGASLSFSYGTSISNIFRDSYKNVLFFASFGDAPDLSPLSVVLYNPATQITEITAIDTGVVSGNPYNYGFTGEYPIVYQGNEVIFIANDADSAFPSLAKLNFNGHMGLVTNSSEAGEPVNIVYSGLVFDNNITQGQTIKTSGLKAYAQIAGEMDVVGWWLANQGNEASNAATIQVGTVNTGEPGTNASIVNVGTDTAAIFNFTIPRGDTGAQGPPGETGDTGPQGDPGPQGEPGTAATIQVGTVTTGAAGSTATVTNSGTSSAAVFDFTIPQGAKGDTGAQGPPGETGDTGPQGDPGPQGEPGQSAYESAVAGGYTGSESSFNSTLSNIGNYVISAATVTLVPIGWMDDNNQIQAVTGVTATNNVIVSPDPASQEDYSAAGIYCSSQGSGVLTFTCGTAPVNDIDVNVLIIG